MKSQAREDDLQDEGDDNAIYGIKTPRLNMLEATQLALLSFLHERVHRMTAEILARAVARCDEE